MFNRFKVSIKQGLCFFSTEGKQSTMFGKCFQLHVSSLNFQGSSVDYDSLSSFMVTGGISEVECTNSLSLETSALLANLSTKQDVN